MLRKVSLLLLALFMMVGVALAEPAGEIIFQLEDPQGDSFGPGNYTYPQHSSFPPELAQMLDLVGFTVSNTENATRFEFEFAQAPNLQQPWGGAGFNFHRIDLYIASGANGSSETFRPGAMVQFRKPWQVNLRLRDWKGGYLIHWQDDNPEDPQAGIWQDQVEGFNVFVQGKSIVAEISHQLLGPAQPQWKYYVLVGLQDAYGPDQYREITEEGGPWTGGGGTEAQFNPNLYDILADGDSQSAQLKWDVGKLAQLQPVGPGAGRSSVFKIIIIAAVVMVAAGVAGFIWIYRK